jgi:hypothetical protein
MRKVGWSAGFKGATEGWTQDFTIAEGSNDWYGFSKIAEVRHSRADDSSISVATLSATSPALEENVRGG